MGTNSERALRNKHKTTGLVICIWNRGHEVSLELRRIYQAIPDSGAEQYHLMRVVDESGEDYLYPENFFLPIEFSKAI